VTPRGIEPLIPA